MKLDENIVMRLKMMTFSGKNFFLEGGKCSKTISKEFMFKKLPTFRAKILSSRNSRM